MMMKTNELWFRVDANNFEFNLQFKVEDLTFRLASNPLSTQPCQSLEVPLISKGFIQSYNLDYREKPVVV